MTLAPRSPPLFGPLFWPLFRAGARGEGAGLRGRSLVRSLSMTCVDSGSSGPREGFARRAADPRSVTGAPPMAALRAAERGCFVCGAAVTPGKERSLQVRPRGDGAPCFPFLQRSHPEPGADGSARVCAVCHLFLGAQWDAFERAGTPLDKRVYWHKRPRERERQLSCRSPGETDACAAHERTPAERGGRTCGENIARSHGVELGMSARSKRPFGGAPSPHSHGCWHPIHASPGRLHLCGGGLSVDAPEAHGGVAVGNKKRRCPGWLARPRVAPQPYRAVDVEEEFSRLSPPGAFGVPNSSLDLRVGNRLCPSDGSVRAGSSEVNVAGDPRSGYGEDDDDDDDEDGNSRSEQHGEGPDRDRIQCAGVVTKPGGCDAVEGHVCYICGSELPRGGRFKVWLRKRERHADRPFFPFLWLHTPPPRAAPLILGGCALVCARCHNSLVRQWGTFELAGVPVLQRLYTVPLGDNGEACYLCGRGCARTFGVAFLPARRGQSGRSMYFPFIGLLPCPPGAKAPRDRQVSCCTLCFSILEDIWAAYCLSQSEELISSATAFLRRYHQALGEGPTQGSSESASICYLCGAESGTEGDFQVRVSPPVCGSTSEPFFPFLGAQAPAPRAKPIDSTGLVSTCVLCYHDMRAQWARHEAQVGQPSGSPWSRRYRCDSFVCFFCQRERRRRLGLQAVRVARLPVFLYAPRLSGTLVMDDGNKLIVGSCVECKVQLTTSGKRKCGQEENSPATKRKQEELRAGCCQGTGGRPPASKAEAGCLSGLQRAEAQC